MWRWPAAYHQPENRCLWRGIQLLAAWMMMCRPVWAEWSAIAEQRTSYTSDAFQFSSARRLALSEDPSHPTVVPVNKPEDVVWEPALEVIRAGSLFSGRNELSVKAQGFIYTDKPVFNHGEFRIQDRQWLNPATSVLLRYRYVPNVFLGPNFERRSGARSIMDERVTSHTWRAELERQIHPHITATLVSRYGLRLYNEAFAERDTHFYTVGPRLAYRARSWLTFIVGYLYERGLAEGRHQPQFSDDVSYYLHFLSFGAGLQLTSNMAVHLTYAHVRKSFTSGLIGDSHAGRQDLTHQGRADVRYQVTKQAAATAAYQRTQRSSTNALRDFNDNIITVGVEYRF